MQESSAWEDHAARAVDTQRTLAKLQSQCHALEARLQNLEGRTPLQGGADVLQLAVLLHGFADQLERGASGAASPSSGQGPTPPCAACSQRGAQAAAPAAAPVDAAADRDSSVTSAAKLSGWGTGACAGLVVGVALGIGIGAATVAARRR